MFYISKMKGLKFPDVKRLNTYVKHTATGKLSVFMSKNFLKS